MQLLVFKRIHCCLMSQLPVFKRIHGWLMSQLPKEQVVAQLSKHGLVVELNEDGQIIRSLHDPSGTLFPSVSEVEEENGILYLGSIDRPYVGRLSLARLPPPVQPGTGTGTSSTASPGRSPSTTSSTPPTSPGKSGEFF